MLQLLDVYPLKELVKNLWNTFQWIYALLMIVHITYMSCLSAYAIPLTAIAIHNNATELPPIFPVVGLVIWPVLILIFVIYYIVFGIVAISKQTTVSSAKLKLQRNWVTLLIAWIFDNMTIWGGALFSATTIAWFVLYSRNSFDQVYLLTATLICGWLFTTGFTKGFETVHAFSIMLKHIILRDIIRFFVIYSFIFMAFGFAMHTLFQISPEIASNYPTVGHSLFTTFNLMIGMDEIFDEDTDANYRKHGSNSIYLRVVYLAYIVLSTIIMLNLLIAMMSDSYNQVRSREGTTWRVASVRMALRLDNSLPFVSKILEALKLSRPKFHFDKSRGRWILPVAKENIVKLSEASTEDELARSMRRLEGKFNHLISDMGSKIETMIVRYDDMTTKYDGLVNKIEALHGGQASSHHDPMSPRSRKSSEKMPKLRRLLTKASVLRGKDF